VSNTKTSNRHFLLLSVINVYHICRGLPHIHLVLILDWDNIEMSKEEYIDNYISAEIPALPQAGDQSNAAELQRRYRDFVVKNMYHTCSPNYCLRDGKCTKGFPVNIFLFNTNFLHFSFVEAIFRRYCTRRVEVFPQISAPSTSAN
jgi:hypothetical protein